MDFDTFIGETQNRAQLDEREEALKATRITLETLSERIDPNAAENLAAQLPEEIGRHLSKIDTVEQFGWDEFADRIVEKGDYTEPDQRGQAIHHARAVIDVVDDAVQGSSLADIRDQLPGDEFEDLFEIADQDREPVEEEQRPE